MANLNQCNVIGTLTRDPELRTVSSGTSTTKLCIAINHKYKDKQETLFLNIVLWGKMAETAHQYLKKGSQAFFSGRLEMNKYTDKNGDERQDWHIVADTMQFLDRKPKDGSSSSQKQEDDGSGFDEEPPF